MDVHVRHVVPQKARLVAKPLETRCIASQICHFECLAHRRYESSGLLTEGSDVYSAGIVVLGDRCMESAFS